GSQPSATVTAWPCVPGPEALTKRRIEDFANRVARVVERQVVGERHHSENALQRRKIAGPACAVSMGIMPGMTRNAITLNDTGRQIMPVSAADWRDWVSATALRNHVLGDPLLDWLSEYGRERGFLPDYELPGYDARTDFTEFIFGQGHRFEAAVVAHLRTLIDVVLIEAPEGSRDLGAAERTFEAMREGAPVIHQAILRDPEHRTYGSADLLVRCDVLRTLFPETLAADEAEVVAPDLGGSWHYRVVDVKFTTLHLAAGGDLANSGSSPAYKAQLFVYNRALGRLQGYEPPSAFLLGRGWEQQKSRGFSAMDRLAPVPQSGAIANGAPTSSAVLAATSWIRAIRAEGDGWSVLPRPTRRELYPNSGNQQDGPWHDAKRRIAEELRDLTLLWQVGVPGRETGHAQGVFEWNDPRVTAAVVKVTGAKRVPVFEALLHINRSADAPPVQPTHIAAAEDDWRATPALEFYVDFETVSDLADDFSCIPERGGQALIFMIGCGHVEDGVWTFRCFVADQLTEDAEAGIIDEWLAHMSAVRERLAPSGDAPQVLHWSPAEVSNFETAYNSAKARHPDRTWESPRWFDFLRRVMHQEPVVVRGAMAFGLKAVAKALHGYGFIETRWGDGPADGLGAMVGAWWSYEAARRAATPASEIELMKQIIAYNEVDCRVMWESVQYFRRNH
ncbi:MAG: hypothetical protein WD942_06745, partial [Dehalococcoidia bacterium]